MAHTSVQELKKIEAESLYDLDFVGSPQLSPCGEKVIYVQTTINDKKNYESHLFVYDRETGESYQWTSGESRNHSPRWSHDGKWIAFVSNRSGDNQIYLISSQGGEAKALTRLKNGATNPVWSPVESKLLFQTNLKEGEGLEEKDEKEKEERDELKPHVVDDIAYKGDGIGLLDDTHPQIILYDVEQDHMESLTDGAYNHMDAAWSPDGTEIAYVRSGQDEPGEYLLSDLYIKPIKGEAYKVNEARSVFSKPNWSPDGTYLSFLGHNRESEGATLNKVWVMPLDSKEPTCLTAQEDLECTDVLISDVHWANPSPGAVWSKDGKGVYFQGSEHGNTELYYAGLDGSVEKVVGGDRHLYGFHYCASRDEAVVAISHPTQVGDLYTLSMTTFEEERLTQSNASFQEEYEVVAPEAFTYTSKDGLEVQGWMMKPAHFDPAQKYPLILQIHGGPHMMYGNTFVHEFQMLAARGYCILYTNPRGSHGYGQEFVNGCRSDYGGGDYEDLMAGVDAALENYNFIDPEQLFVTGGSYGGFMTNWIVAHTDRFKAAVTQRSISNWHSFFGVSDIGYFFTKWEIGEHFTDNPEKLWDHSPIKYVNSIETPLLIMHAEEDYRCPIEQAEQLFIALKHRQKPTRFIRFPKSDHNLSRVGPPTLRIERLRHMVDWFDTYKEDETS